MILSLVRIFWKGGTSVTPFRSCSRSSSHPLRPTTQSVQHSPPWTPPPPRQTLQKQEQIKSQAQRASSLTTHLPVMETPRPHPSQTAILLDSSPASWAKVRMYCKNVLWFIPLVLLWYNTHKMYASVQYKIHTSFFPPVCTQLLVSRPDEENISCYLQLIEKCLTHEVRTCMSMFLIFQMHTSHLYKVLIISFCTI